jgi:hypothetical protein
VSDAQDPVATPELLKACIAALAQKDREFRHALLSNGRAAVETALGEALPPQIKINVVQEGPDTYTVVLPYEPEIGAGGELSDDDLESVAGGAKSGATAYAQKVGGKALDMAFGGPGGLVSLNGRFDLNTLGAGLGLPPR